jgi:hypothetical protein
MKHTPFHLQMVYNAPLGEKVSWELGGGASYNKSGVPIDLTQLKPEQLEALVEHLDEMTVEVDQPDAKVRFFCESAPSGRTAPREGAGTPSRGRARNSRARLNCQLEV